MNKKPYQKSQPGQRSRSSAPRTLASSKNWNGYDEKRPMMKKDTLKKTRYKIPKAAKASKELSTVQVKETSWGKVAEWYDKHLEKGGETYHEKVVHPNLLRMLGELKGKQVIDLACGQGIFSRMMADKGASVVGVDLGKELIDLAEKRNREHKFKVHFFQGASDDLYMVKDGTKDIVVCVLALQNIEKLQETFREVSRVLKTGGRFIAVLNHPAFRNPTHTHWGFDDHEGVQYRRVEEYLSESKVKIDMTPGSKTDKKFTMSFHRPLQVYSKALSKNGLAIFRLEEWVSHKESQRGPRKNAEDKTRKEIPLFLSVETIKL